MKLVDLEKLLKDAAAENADGALRKVFDVEVVRTEGQPLRIAITSEAVDRDQDTIALGGWKLDEYRKNPVVLWMHDRWAPPIARSKREWIEGGKMWSEPEFTPADLNPFGHMIGEMVRQGFVNGASVGFKPIKYVFNEERGGVDFLEQEMREYSMCTIQSNTEAMVGRSKAAGIDVTPMVAWAERVLDMHKGTGFWVPRNDLEQLWKAAKPEKTISAPPPAPAAAPVSEGLKADDVSKLITDATARWVQELRTSLTGRLD